MSRGRQFILTMWQPLLIYGITVALLLLLFAFRLNHLPGTISADEAQAVKITGNWHELLNNPIYLPHKLVLFAFQAAGLKKLALLRSASVFWALVIILLFFSTLRHWFSKRVAIIGSLLLASSSWFLWAARSLTPEIMQSSLVALLAVGGWLRYSHARIGPMLSGVFLIALVCYIPGTIWFVLLALLWQRRAVKKFINDAPGLLTVAAIIVYVILVLPLLYALVRNPHLIQTLLGLPLNLSSWQQYLRNILNVPLSIFVRAPINPARWVGQAPLLDLFGMVMFVLGMYNFFFLRKLDRAKVLLGLSVIVTLLITLGGGVTIIMLLPAIYIVIACGIDLLLQQWFIVFPRNPLARGIGLALLVCAVLIASAYQTDRYYRAWVNAPATKAIIMKSCSAAFTNAPLSYTIEAIRR